MNTATAQKILIRLPPVGANPSYGLLDYRGLNLTRQQSATLQVVRTLGLRRYGDQLYPVLGHGERPVHAGAVGLSSSVLDHDDIIAYVMFPPWGDLLDTDALPNYLDHVAPLLDTARDVWLDAMSGFDKRTTLNLNPVHTGVRVETLTLTRAYEFAFAGDQ